MNADSASDLHCTAECKQHMTEPRRGARLLFSSLIVISGIIAMALALPDFLKAGSSSNQPAGDLPCPTLTAPAPATNRTIGVFVALADNDHQGIVPVPKAIGNGDDPDRNLYWGCSDGLQGVFAQSPSWRSVPGGENVKNKSVLRCKIYQHTSTNIVLTARAYRGSEIKQCIMDFEQAVQSGSFDMVVYIGHNGLMDFELPVPPKATNQQRTPDCIVLCCRSEWFFLPRLKAMGGHPILLTRQLMYPGAFILHAAIEQWKAGADSEAIRKAAGAAYARNQKISVKSATGVFADLTKKK